MTKSLSVPLCISGTACYIFVIFGTRVKWCLQQFLNFFKMLIYSGFLGGKRAKDDPKNTNIRLSCYMSQELQIISSRLVHRCKKMIFPGLFLYFSKKIQHNCAAFLSRKTNLLDFSIKIDTQPHLSWFDQTLVISCLKLRFLCCLLAQSNIFFFNKQLFFKFINKWQKEILRCAPPSSHACDFLLMNQLQMELWVL